jgi:predicted transcriptional regulator
VLDADRVRLESMIDEQAVERLADGTTKTKSRFFEEAVEGLWLGDRR